MKIEFNNEMIIFNENIVQNSLNLVEIIRNNPDIYSDVQTIELVSIYLLLLIIREIDSDDRLNYLIEKILDSYYPITDDDKVNKTIDRQIYSFLNLGFKTRYQLENHIRQYLQKSS